LGLPNQRLLPRVVHRDYFAASGVADIEREPERFGYVRPLGNDVYAFLAQQVELAGAVTLRNVHAEHLAEMACSVDAAWQQAYANAARLIANGAFQQSVTRTGTGNDWAVWIGDNFTSSCALLPEFYDWCRAQLQGDNFMVCIASSQLVFVLRNCPREALAKFDPVVGKMLEGSQCQVSTAWFHLNGDGLAPLPAGGASGGPTGAAPGTSYRIALAGIREGVTREQVATALATLFAGYDHAKIMALLERPGVVVKRGVDAATAQQYRAALENCGCLCAIVAESAPAAAPKPVIQACFQACFKAAKEIGVSPLVYAAMTGDAPLVTALVADGADPSFADQEGFTAAMFAAELGKTEALKALVAAKAKLDVRNRKGFTAATIAAEYGQLDTLKVLIAAGADLDVGNDVGMNTLMMAIQNDHEAVARVLIGAGVDVEHQSEQGYRALALAAQHGRVEVVKMLLAAHAEVNPPHPQGITAAMLACQGGYLDILKLLAAAGADLQAKASNGFTAKAIAQQFKHTEIIDFLRRGPAQGQRDEQDRAPAGNKGSGLGQAFKTFRRILNRI